MKKEIAAVLILLFFGSYFKCVGQQNIRDSVENLIKNLPHFTIYQDNYIITGIPIGELPTKQNSNAKFQISFKERLTDAVLPFSTYLYLTYTQKSFWDIYINSSPFSETNYNPALCIGKIIKNKKSILSAVAILIEHESNGRDSIYSRNWNRLRFNYVTLMNHSTTMTFSAWLPFSYKVDNPDLIKYVGYGEVALNWKTKNKRLFFDIIARKGASWSWKGSVQSQFSYRFAKNINVYLVLQCFTGYAESLINYTVYTNMIRIGLIMKPTKFI